MWSMAAPGTDSAASLTGRVALVTGAGRGIGRAIAIELARAGASVAIAARTTSELDATLGEITAMGAKAVAMTVDLTDRGEAARLGAEVAIRFGPVDILVNNAGVGSSIDPRPVAEFSDQTWDLTLATNLTAPYLLCKAMLPAMIARRWGRVINIASIVASIGAEAGSAYAASKGGLVAFTKSLALEVAKNGVTANAICPGPVRTQTSDKRLGQIAAERGVDFADLESRLTPMGRRLDPEEIAHVAVFLASDRAAAITGQAWNVDAGAVMR
jgi:NAD(P)-dependent dehydrogenase (short-subunit alcohol dehydrogenase family)